MLSEVHRGWRFIKRAVPTPCPSWELVSKGTDIKVARGVVAREEAKRLERIAAQRAAPVDVEAASAEGHSSGEDEQTHSGKRMRMSLPEAGLSAQLGDGQVGNGVPSDA